MLTFPRRIEHFEKRLLQGATVTGPALGLHDTSNVVVHASSLATASATHSIVSADH
jgi:hypothetical protein